MMSGKKMNEYDPKFKIGDVVCSRPKIKKRRGVSIVGRRTPYAWNFIILILLQN